MVIVDIGTFYEGKTFIEGVFFLNVYFAPLIMKYYNKILIISSFLLFIRLKETTLRYSRSCRIDDIGTFYEGKTS